jgi:hypothetical protein
MLTVYREHRSAASGRQTAAGGVRTKSATVCRSAYVTYVCGRVLRKIVDVEGHDGALPILIIEIEMLVNETAVSRSGRFDRGSSSRQCIVGATAVARSMPLRDPAVQSPR